MPDGNMQAPSPTSQPWRLYTARQRWFFLCILFLVSLSNYADRLVMSVLLEPIKKEFHATDTQMGLLSGFAFGLLYAVLGLPVARIADRGNRRAVISLSIATWSIMTMFCGVARSLPQLFLARIGVGIGEAGAVPPAQSLIVDYFPPEQRGRALSLFMASSMAGYLIAFIIGAQLATDHGWRVAFIALGAPGLLLALVAWFGLSEPRRLLGSLRSKTPTEPIPVTMRALAGKRSFRLLCIVFILYYFVAYGAIAWLPAYSMRVLNEPMANVGAQFGFVNALAAVLGTVGGGILGDRLVKRDHRWLVWWSGALMIGSWPFFTAAMLIENFNGFLAASGIAMLALNAAVPALFLPLHRVCGSPRRATAVAVTFFFANFLGVGLGPLATGALSDQLGQTMGMLGLRYALLASFAVLLPAGLLLFAMASKLEVDIED